jgi:riboflavin biosynthesis pyrimidine reductase
VARQYLRAGLVDELTIHVVPLLLGDGARLFEDPESASKGYECVELVSSPAAAHFTYVRRGG